PVAAPSSRLMIQLCSGQATLRPCTIPSARGAAFVRAAVFQSEYLVARRAEDRDLATRRSHRACAAPRNRMQRADVEPEISFLSHRVAHPTLTGAIRATTARGINSRSLRPSARSAHG